jgi:shikimate dehydrogenase
VDAVASLGLAEAAFQRWQGSAAVADDTDILVNATSVGMLDPDERPEVDLAGLRPDAIVADVVIAARPTALLAAATARGLRTVPGNEMLVLQAAIGYEVWTGRPANLGVLRAALAEAQAA